MNSTLKRRKSIELAGRVDLGLVRGLRLAEHRGRVERVAPRAGEQLGRAQEHGGALLPGPARPVLPRLPRRPRSPARTCSAPPWWTSASTCSRSCGITAGFVVPGEDVLAADHERDLEPLARHLLEPRLQRGALGAAGLEAARRARCGRAERGRCRGCPSVANQVGGGHEHPDHEPERRGPEGRADERPVGRRLADAEQQHRDPADDPGAAEPLGAPCAR